MADNKFFSVRETEKGLKELDNLIEICGYEDRTTWYKSMKRNTRLEARKIKNEKESRIMKKIVETAMEAYNLTGEQAEYINKELDFDYNENEESIVLRNTNTTNSNSETIYDVVLSNGDKDRHICYI